MKNANYLWIFGGALLALGAQGQPHRSVWDGVYTTQQASRGKIGYARDCSRCHRDDLSGYNGVLLGGRFMDRWREDSVQSLFQNIRATMPRDAPASLSDEDYLDIVAWVLRANAFPPGTRELTAAELSGIRIEAKQGPQPVPDFALIEVAGCLAQGPDGAWTVTNGSEPVRTRNPGASSDDELKAAKQTALGKHVFHLMDTDTIPKIPGKGNTVLAKGFLIRQPEGDRINLTALQTLDSNCLR